MPNGTTGSPLQLTITPQACPWGFNTANRGPTIQEQLAHDQCILQQLESQASTPGIGDVISAELRVLIDELWAGLKWLGDNLLSPLFGPVYQWFKDGLTTAWNAIKQAAEGFGLVAVGLLLLGLYFAPQIGEAFGRYHSHRAITHER